MLTGKRLRAAKERDRLGLPPASPPTPTTISMAEHERAMADLRIAHGQELAAARKEGGSGERVGLLESQLLESEKTLGETLTRVAELEALLAEATKPEPAKPSEPERRRPR